MICHSVNGIATNRLLAVVLQRFSAGDVLLHPVSGDNVVTPEEVAWCRQLVSRGQDCCYIPHSTHRSPQKRLILPAVSIVMKLRKAASLSTSAPGLYLKSKCHRFINFESSLPITRNMIHKGMCFIPFLSHEFPHLKQAFLNQTSCCLLELQRSIQQTSPCIIS